ncbi:serine hydrolase domain-containing protein [Hyphococcus sp.]|uniref:serine hydrolase domain-containing protein n=1 Tax=Hyphococcus sp. TaxID=2038636 RepID=UPI003CCC3F01
MFNKRFIPLLLIGVVALVSGCNSAPSVNDPLRTDALDAIAEQAASDGFPGVVIAMSEAPNIVVTGAAGVSDRVSGTPMKPDDRIHAASTTKPFTAAAILRLWDEGALDLDATLPDVLEPEIVDLVPNGDRITVRDLLLHTSGIYSPNNDPDYLARYIGPERLEKEFWSAREIIAFAANPDNAPLFSPGDGQQYGDINYVLLSLVVENVSGRPFKEFVRSEIFERAGMQDTYFMSDDRDRSRARGYTVDSEILRSIGLDPALTADSLGLIDTTDAQEQSDGAAGVITTAPDLVRFANAFLKGDLISLKSRQFVLAVAELADEEDEALGVLRAYRTQAGVVVAAEGDGPGTNVLWAMDMETGKIAAIGVTLFGRWDENDYMFGEMLPAVFEAQSP